MAQELSLKIRLDVDTQAAVQKLSAMFKQLQESMAKLGANPKIFDTGALEKEFSKINTQLDMSAQKSSQAKGHLENLSTQLKATAESGSLLGKAFQFNQISQATMILSQSLSQFTQPFIDFEAGLADLSAITGLSGAALDDFGERARALAKTFGGEATQQIDAFKGILSRLGPDIAKSPEALEKMATAVNTLSKASGLDAAASMDALTNGMLQFGVDLSDPIQAADEMTKMMHVMAAGAQQGAAEVPQVSQAIVAAGVAASGAKLSFEETNSAIQVLATGGKYGAEAGTALRNSLALLQKQTGPGEAQLKAMGLTVKELGDTLTTQGLQPTLVKLGEGFNKIGTDAEKNAALFQLFGAENAAAMGILLKNTDMMADLTTKMTGTNTAFEQAAVNMGTMQTSLDRIKANIQDQFITVFQTLGTEVTTAIGAITQLAPVLTTFASVQTLLPDGALANIKNIPNLFNNALPALTNFSTKLTGMIPGLASVGTAGTAMFTQMGIAGTTAGTATTTAWVSALAPIMAVIGAVALLGAGFIYLYNNVESFRNFIDGVLEVGEYGFQRLWEVLKKVGDIIMSVGSVVLQYLFMPFQIGMDIISSFLNVFSGIGDETKTANDAIGILSATFNVVDKALLNIKASMDAFRESLTSITSSISGVITKVISGDIIGATKELMEAGPNAAKAFSEGFTKSITTSGIEDNAKKLSEELSKASDVKLKISGIAGLDNLSAEYQKTIEEINKLQVKPQSAMTKEEIAKLEALKLKAQETANDISKIAPSTKENMKTIIDENGKIKEVFDINIAKVKEFASTQKTAYSTDLVKAQQEYSATLLESSSLYDQQKKQLDEMAKKATALKQAGKNDEYKKQIKDMQEFGTKVDESKQKLIQGFQEGVKGGTLTKEALDKVGKQLGLNNDQIKKAEELQQDFKGEIELTSDAITSMGNAFSEAMSTAKSSQGDAVGALAELRRQLKAGTIDEKTYNEQRKQVLDQGKQATKEYNQLLKFESQAKADLGLLEKKNASSKSKTQISEIEKAKKIYDQEKRNLQQGYDQYEINSEMLRIEQERSKNTYDEIAEGQKKLEQLEEEKKKFLEIYNLQIADNKVVSVGLKFGKDEDKNKIIQDLNNEYQQIETNLQKEINKKNRLYLELGIDNEKIIEELDKQEINKIKFNIEMGVQTDDDLVKEYQNQYDRIATVISDEERKLKELIDKRIATKNQGSTDLILEAQIKSIEDNLDKLKEVELKKREEIESEKDRIRKESLEKLRTQNNEELKLFEEDLVNQSRLSQIILDSLSKSMVSNYDNEISNKKNDLKTQLDEGLITQQEHDGQVEELERQHQVTLKNIQDAARGAELESERQQTILLLEEKKKRLESELALIDKKKNPDEYKKVENELNELNAAIDEKGNLLIAHSEEIKLGVSTTFASLLGDDDEAMKASARKMFATLAGILQKAASATVTKMILDQLGIASTGTGLGALLLAPMIQGLVSAGISKIINPMIQGLLSFSTGGRVDEPTIAIVGDASQARPGKDTEWIFRDDHLMLIVSLALSKHSKEIAKVLADSLSSLDMDSVVRFYNDNLNYNIIELNKNIDKLSQNVISISNRGLTYEDIYRISEYTIQRLDNDVKFDTGRITEDEYLKRYSEIEIKAISFATGSGSIYQPTVSIVGDAGVNNPERVLNDPQLREIISETSERSSSELKTLMREMISTLQSIDFDVYIDSRIATDEVNRENNRRKVRFNS